MGSANIDVINTQRFEVDILPSAKDYVQNGLVTMWDGIENAGYGVHDDTAIVWKDLIGHSDISFPVLPDSNKAKLGWGYNHFKYVGNYNNSLSPTFGILSITPDVNLLQVYNNNTPVTFEMVINVVQDTPGNRLYMPFGWIGSYAYIAACPFYTDNTIYSFPNAFSAKEGKVLTLSEGITYLNGTKTRVNTNLNRKNNGYSEGETYTFCTRGNYDSDIKQFYCFRIYNRALSDEEVLYNTSIDKARFNLP